MRSEQACWITRNDEQLTQCVLHDDPLDEPLDKPVLIIESPLARLKALLETHSCHERHRREQPRRLFCRPRQRQPGGVRHDGVIFRRTVGLEA